MTAQDYGKIIVKRKWLALLIGLFFTIFWIGGLSGLSMNPDNRIFFSQLLGMSDHISYNLSKNGYNVAKYVPYGPVKDVLPYLIRRANENTSISGQMGRELSNIIAEKKRRKKS